MKESSSRVAARPKLLNEPEPPHPLVPRGRPTLYRREFCEVVLEEMGKGYSIGAVAGTLRVCRDTITQWMRDHPEFSAAVKKGKALRLKQWETIALGNASGQINGNSGMCALGLKNAGADDWTDKQEVVVVDQREDDALEFIAGRLAELEGRIREESDPRRLN